MKKKNWEKQKKECPRCWKFDHGPHNCLKARIASGVHTVHFFPLNLILPTQVHTWTWKTRLPTPVSCRKMSVTTIHVYVDMYSMSQYAASLIPLATCSLLVYTHNGLTLAFLVTYLCTMTTGLRDSPCHFSLLQKTCFSFMPWSFFFLFSILLELFLNCLMHYGYRRFVYIYLLELRGLSFELVNFQITRLTLILNNFRGTRSIVISLTFHIWRE